MYFSNVMEIVIQLRLFFKLKLYFTFLRYSKQIPNFEKKRILKNVYIQQIKLKNILFQRVAKPVHYTWKNNCDDSVYNNLILIIPDGRPKIYFKKKNR